MLEKQLPYKYRVYDAIKQNILTGVYAPGFPLNERKLSEELGISRTPIREALQMLEQDGWLVTETYKGTVVREFDAEYLHEIMDIRTALELLAIREAVKRVRKEDIEKLEAIQKEQEGIIQNSDSAEFIVIDRRFHSYLYQMSGNRELMHLTSNYYDIFRFLGMQAILGSRERTKTTVAEHQVILDAIKAGDAEAAIEAMRYHMEQTEANVNRHISVR